MSTGAPGRDASQTRIVPLLSEVRIRLPSRLNSALIIGASPRSTRTACPRSKSQSLAVESAEAVRSVCPSGLNDAARMGARWPGMGNTVSLAGSPGALANPIRCPSRLPSITSSGSLGVSTLQTLAVLSEETVTTCEPTRFAWSDSIGPRCPPGIPSRPPTSTSAESRRDRTSGSVSNPPCKTTSTTPSRFETATERPVALNTRSPRRATAAMRPEPSSTRPVSG